MSRTIILVSGKQRAGKNDVSYLVNRGLGFTFCPTSFAQPIKELYAAKYSLSTMDVERLKNDRPEVRTALIEISATYKAKNLHHWVDKALEQPGNLIISDLRYRHELERVQELTKEVYTIRVDASREVRAFRGVLSNEDDLSECDLDNYEDWHYTIDNNYSPDSLLQQCELVSDSLKDFLYRKKVQ